MYEKITQYRVRPVRGEGGGTVPQKPTDDDVFQTYVLRFKYHLFSQTISNCIFKQFVGFSYLTTKYFMKSLPFYPKILAVENMMNIFKLFINKLASISQNCYNFFSLSSGFCWIWDWKNVMKNIYPEALFMV